MYKLQKVLKISTFVLTALILSAILKTQTTFFVRTKCISIILDKIGNVNKNDKNIEKGVSE